MQITLQCPSCKKDMEYVKDKTSEALGYYTFMCNNCKDKYSTPKNNPLIDKK